MVSKLGYETYIGWGEESSLGTVLATPTKFGEYSSESMQKEFNEQLIDAINGTRNYKKRVTLEESVGGSIEMPVVPLMECMILKNISACNFSTTALSVGSCYQHDFHINSVVSNTSLTFQIARDTGDTSSTYNYTGCRINSADFGTSVGGLLTMGLDIMGIDVAAANTIATASYGTNNPYTFKNCTIGFGSTSAASTTISVESFNVTIAQNLIEDRSLGSATRDRIELGMADVTGEITLRYEDQTYLNYFLNQTPFYIQAEFDSGITISATNTHKITFRLPECYFNGSMPNVGSAGEIIKQTLPFRAVDCGSNGSMTIEVITSLTTPAS